MMVKPMGFADGVDVEGIRMWRVEEEESRNTKRLGPEQMEE